MTKLKHTDEHGSMTTSEPCNHPADRQVLLTACQPFESAGGDVLRFFTGETQCLDCGKKYPTSQSVQNLLDFKSELDMKAARKASRT